MKRKLPGSYPEWSDEQGEIDEKFTTKFKTSINEQLLFVLGEVPTSETGINSSIAVRKWIKSRGVLIELLTSTRFITEEIKLLSDLSLVRLFSALIDVFITENNDKNIKNKNNIGQLLTFVERVLVQRYNVIYNLQNHLFFETWTHIADSNKVALGNITNINTDEGFSSSDPTTESENIGNGAVGDWIICLSFIMSYDILYKRLAEMKNKMLDLISNKSRDEIDSTELTPGKNVFVKAARDPIVLKSLQIMFLLQFIEVHSTGESVSVCKSLQRKLRGKDSILKKIFGPNLRRVDSLVQSIQNEILMQRENKYEELFDDPMFANKNQQDSVFSKLLAEVEKEADENCAVDEYDNRRISSSLDGNKIRSVFDKEKDDEIHLTLIPMSQNEDSFSEQKEILNENETEKKERTTEDVMRDETLEIMSGHPSIASSAKILRSHLIEGTDALKNINDKLDVADLTKKIAELVNFAGNENGAKGVLLVGFILTFGVDNEEDWLEELNRFSSSTYEPRKFEMPLTDIIVSDLCKTCVHEESSSVRASAFMKCFIFPLLLNLTATTRFASRTLASILSSMVRERPIECIKSIILPVLGGPQFFSVTTNLDQGKKLELRPNSPTQAQCELVSRILKSVVIKKENISILVSGLTTNSYTTDMALNLTDATLPILTTCLKKKIILSDQVVKILAENVVRLSNETSVLKSMKYSTFFHTLVTKHGSQINNLQLSSDMLAASSKIKTFMGKTITSVLRKLQT